MLNMFNFFKLLVMYYVRTSKEKQVNIRIKWVSNGFNLPLFKISIGSSLLQHGLQPVFGSRILGSLVL